MSVPITDDPDVPQKEPSSQDDSDRRFPPSSRLQKRSDFVRLRRRGKRAEGRWVVVYAAKGGTDENRLGITASKKVGNAVVRNRWKRRLRDIFRRNKGQFGDANDVVIIVKKPRRDPTYQELRDDVFETTQRALRPRRGGRR